MPLRPEAVLATPLEELRACGLSGAKASYVLDLASHYADGRITCAGLKGGSRPSEDSVVRICTFEKALCPGQLCFYPCLAALQQA